MHPVASPAELSDLARSLRDSGQPVVVAVHGAHAHDLLSAALADEPVCPEADTDARFRTGDALWLHDGPGARAVADARVAAHAVDRTGVLWLSGACVHAGVPDVATHVVAASPCRPGPAHPTRLVHAEAVDAATVVQRFSDGDMLGAHIAWEVAGSPARHAWVETLRLILCRRYRAAWDHSEGALAVEPTWRWFTTTYLAYQTLDFYTLRRVVAYGLAHGRDPVALGALRATLAIVDSTPPPHDSPPWMVAYHARVHEHPPPDTPFARALYDHGDDPLPALGRGVFTNTWVRSQADPLAMQRLRALWARHQQGDTVRAAEVPPLEVLGVYERAGCLLRGQLALRDGDMVTMRRCAEELPRTSAQVMPHAMLEAAIAAEGVPWARRVWLEALARTYGSTPPAVDHDDEPTASLGDDPATTESGPGHVRLALRRAREQAQMLDDYELMHVLARGSAGTVWQAVHRPTDTPVAIKTLTEAGDADAFRREIDLVSRLEHPAIAAVLDRGVVDDPALGTVGAPYLVMELVTGGTLRSQRGRLPFTDLHPLVLALLDALAYAHAGGVLHRDVKPDNVLVDPNGGVRLTDFGLAALPRRGAVAGTPAYMAPEQLQGEASRRSDLYALGATVWALCAGRSPLPARLADRRVHDPAHLGPFRPVVPVPANLGDWLARAMAPRPSQRFRDAAEMAAAFDGLGPVVAPTAHHLPAVSQEEPTFVLHDLLDLPASMEEESLRTVSRTGALWSPDRRVHWRPRLPTPRLLDAGDPPLLFRDEAKEALWTGLMRAAAGERVHVHLRGPPQTGQRRLVDWLRRHAEATGLRLGAGTVGHPRLHTADDGRSDGADRATLHVSWSEAAAPTADQTVATPRYRPLQVFWMLRSRAQVPLDLAVNAARLAVGRPTLAIRHLEDWLSEPGAAPGPRGLKLLRTPPAVGPRARAFWQEVVDALPADTRHSWTLLASQAAGFTETQASSGLSELGHRPVDPAEVACPDPVRWHVPSALAAVLGKAPPDQVHALAQTDQSSELQRLFVALSGGADPWTTLARVPLHKRIDPLMQELLWDQALARGDAPFHAIWRLRLAHTDQPLFYAHEAMHQGDHLAAAIAYARTSAAPHDAPGEILRLRTVFSQLRSDEPFQRSCRSEVAAVMAMLNVTEGDPELRALLLAEEAAGTLTDTARCMVRRSLAQGDDDEASMRGLLDIVAELHPPQPYRELLVSAVVMWALNRGDTALGDEAMAALDRPVRYVTGHIASALVATHRQDLVEARRHLERAFVTYPVPGQFIDLAWCLWLGLELDAPQARWNDLASELTPPPSPALAHALRSLAPFHLGERAERLRALAVQADRPLRKG